MIVEDQTQTELATDQTAKQIKSKAEDNKPSESDSELSNTEKELAKLGAFKAKIEEEQRVQAAAEKLVAKQAKQAVNVSDTFFGSHDSARQAPEAKSNLEQYGEEMMEKGLPKRNYE